MPEIPCRHDRTFLLEPARAALIVIDMQRQFIDPEGAVARSGADVSPMAAVVPTVAALLAAARQAGLMIVHTREGHEPGLSDVSATKAAQYAASGVPIGVAGPLGRAFVRGEAGHDFVLELRPLDGEAVVDKPGFGAFFATDLDHRLRNKGITQLLICGVTTQCCVHSTLREAVDRGFACLTVADACGTSDPVVQAAALAIIASEGHLFGWIAETGDVVAALA